MNNWLDKLRQKTAAWMAGRYGADQLNFALLILALVVTLIGSATPIRGVTVILSYALIVLAFFRMFSKDRTKRAQENWKYISLTNKIRQPVSQWLGRLRGRKQYRYFTCPKCHAKLRVPRGAGNVTITCRQCGEKFEGRA